MFTKPIRSIMFIVAAGFIITAPLYAVADVSGKQFRVDMTFTSGDVTPPTAPSNLGATGLTATAISLSWDASVDDLAVRRYEIFRDGVSIALTNASGTTFTDTGLVPLTTYTYTVRAEDFGGNVSPMSATATAATLAPPPSSQTTSQGVKHSSSLIYNLSVEVGIHDAIIRWTTSAQSIGTISWGKTVDNEIGSLREEGYITKHETKITNLDPNTRYYFDLTILTRGGEAGYEHNQTFVTRTAPDTTAPSNPSAFTAIDGDANITLSWLNPSDSDFASVRLVRSDKFYPTDIFDGKIVYEGKDEIYIDTDIADDIQYYYTIFALDRNGNYSSGAITSAIHGHIPSEGGLHMPPTGGFTPQEPFIPGTTTTMSTTSQEILSRLTLSDFEFIQDGIRRKSDAATNQINIDASRQFVVRLPYDRVPEVLKVIAITLGDPEDEQKAFSFLLRVDKEKEYFTATIDRLEREGKYSMRATVVDFKNREVKRLEGVLIAHYQIPMAVVSGGMLRISDIILRYGPRTLSLIVLLLAVLYIVAWWSKKIRQEKMDPDIRIIHESQR